MIGSQTMSTIEELTKQIYKDMFSLWVNNYTI